MEFINSMKELYLTEMVSLDGKVAVRNTSEENIVQEDQLQYLLQKQIFERLEDDINKVVRETLIKKFSNEKLYQGQPNEEGKPFKFPQQYVSQIYNSTDIRTILEYKLVFSSTAPLKNSQIKRLLSEEFFDELLKERFNIAKTVYSVYENFLLQVIEIQEKVETILEYLKTKQGKSDSDIFSIVKIKDFFRSEISIHIVNGVNSEQVIINTKESLGITPFRKISNILNAGDAALELSVEKALERSTSVSAFPLTTSTKGNNKSGVNVIFKWLKEVKRGFYCSFTHFFEQDKTLIISVPDMKFLEASEFEKVDNIVKAMLSFKKTNPFAFKELLAFTFEKREDNKFSLEDLSISIDISFVELTKLIELIELKKEHVQWLKTSNTYTKGPAGVSSKRGQSLYVFLVNEISTPNGTLSLFEVKEGRYQKATKIAYLKSEKISYNRYLKLKRKNKGGK